MQTEKDIYDLEVERLTDNHEDIHSAWADASGLFKYIGNIDLGNNDERLWCGCLTMIQGGTYSAYINGTVNTKLTDAIRNDELIPDNSLNITPQHLPRFAYWQRIVDALNRGEEIKF